MQKNKIEHGNAGAEGSRGYIIKMILSITLICVVIALILSVVDAVTRDTIAENEVRTRREAILELFASGDPEVDEAIEIIEYSPDGGELVYAVADGEALLGYCISASGTGFGGEIGTMVGFTPSGSVKGVKIVSMEETPGVGTKTRNTSFLDLFRGKSEKTEIGGDIDGITGATMSSRGVAESVNNALLARPSIDDLTESLGLIVNEGEGK